MPQHPVVPSGFARGAMKNYSDIADKIKYINQATKNFPIDGKLHFLEVLTTVIVHVRHGLDTRHDGLLIHNPVETLGIY